MAAHDLTLEFFLRSSRGTVLSYLGVEHSRDPRHPQFALIQKRWKEFLIQAKCPTAIIETLGWKSLKESAEESTLRGGEAEFTAFLASAAGVPYKCLEPSRRMEMHHLATLFPREQIEYYYFARVAAQWYRAASKPSIQEYVQWFLK